MVPDLTRPELESASNDLIGHLKSDSLEERRAALRGIIHEVVAERDGDSIEAFITYYHPPPFDLAPTDVLSISRDPVGAHLYRQTFTYPARIKTRSS